MSDGVNRKIVGDVVRFVTITTQHTHANWTSRKMDWEKEKRRKISSLRAACCRTIIFSHFGLGTCSACMFGISHQSAFYYYYCSSSPIAQHSPVCHPSCVSLLKWLTLSEFVQTAVHCRVAKSRRAKNRMRFCHSQLVGHDFVLSLGGSCQSVTQTTSRGWSVCKITYFSLAILEALPSLTASKTIYQSAQVYLHIPNPIHHACLPAWLTDSMIEWVDIEHFRSHRLNLDMLTHHNDMYIERHPPNSKVIKFKCNHTTRE